MNVQLLQSKIGARLQGDRVIWLVIGLLAIFSVLTVYSSAEALALRTGVGTESFLAKHIVLLLGAMLLIYACHSVNYQKYGRLSVVFFSYCCSLAYLYAASRRNLQSGNKMDSNSLYRAYVSNIRFC